MILPSLESVSQLSGARARVDQARANDAVGYHAAGVDRAVRGSVPDSVQGALAVAFNRLFQAPQRHSISRRLASTGTQRLWARSSEERANDTAPARGNDDCVRLIRPGNNLFIGPSHLAIATQLAAGWARYGTNGHPRVPIVLPASRAPARRLFRPVGQETGVARGGTIARADVHVPVADVQYVWPGISAAGCTPTFQLIQLISVARCERSIIAGTVRAGGNRIALERHVSRGCRFPIFSHVGIAARRIARRRRRHRELDHDNAVGIETTNTCRQMARAVAPAHGCLDDAAEASAEVAAAATGGLPIHRDRRGGARAERIDPGNGIRH